MYQFGPQITHKIHKGTLENTGKYKVQPSSILVVLRCLTSKLLQSTIKSLKHFIINLITILGTCEALDTCAQTYKEHQFRMILGTPWFILRVLTKSPTWECSSPNDTWNF